MPVAHAVREERERLRAQGLKQCTMCREVKNPNEFHAWARGWDGLAPQCRACKRASSAGTVGRYRDRWAAEDPQAVAGTKRCRTCTMEFPRAAFYIRRAAPDGLSDNCKSCSDIDDVARRAARQERWAVEDPYANPEPKRCPTCAKDLPRSAYALNSGVADGLHWNCKDCATARQAALQARYRTRWAVEDPYANPEPKRCGKCRQYRPRSAFYTNPSTADGLLSQCRGCNIATVQSREAKKRGQWVEHVDRDVLWKRDQGICYLCGLPADPDRWDLEHIHPLSHGGEHSYANTAVSHPSCNYSKGGNPWPDVSFDPAL